jgi:hypothetical protein
VTGLINVCLADRKKNFAATSPAEFDARSKTRPALRAHHNARQTRATPTHTAADAAAARRSYLTTLPAGHVRTQDRLYDLLA